MLNWGILGTGRIAAAWVEAVPQTGSRVVAVAGRNPEHVREFARNHRIAHACADFDALLQRPEIDAVYVAVPHSAHFDLSMRAIAAGKAVLCEKPAALTAHEVETMILAARTRNVVWREGYMYRWHPQTRRLLEELRAGTIGAIRRIEASFGFRDTNADSRLFDPALGGGAIWDIGGYTLSMACLVAGAAAGIPAIPERMTALGIAGPDGVDRRAEATLRFPGGILAALSCACDCNLDQTLRIYGETGHISVPAPWTADRHHAMNGKITIETAGNPARIVDVPAAVTAFVLEAQGFEEAVRNGGATPYPVMTPEESIVQAGLLEQWRRLVLASSAAAS